MHDNNATRSQWLVFGLTVAALLLGWVLRSSALNQTRIVEQRGVTVNVPAHWLVKTPGGGLNGSDDSNIVLSSWDPLDPGIVYTVRMLPAGTDFSLSTTASFHNLQRAQTETAYRVIDQTPVTLAGRDGYRVRFAYVDASEMSQAPVVYEGADYYFLENGAVLVVTLETYHSFDEAFSAFKDFAATAHYGEAQ